MDAEQPRAVQNGMSPEEYAAWMFLANKKALDEPYTYAVTSADLTSFIQQEIAKVDEKAHLIGFKNGEQATLRRVNDLWAQLMIDEVGSEKAFAYRDAINAELSETLKEHKEE